MWWTISSGQEPVSTCPWYGDCTTQCSVFSVHAVTDVMIVHDVMFASLHRMETDPSALPELKATLTLSVC